MPAKLRILIGSVLGGVFLLSIVLLVVIGFWFRPTPNTFEFEIVKAVLQVGVISIIALIFSLISFEYQRDREQTDKDRERKRQESDNEQDLYRRQLEYRDDLLKATLRRAMTSYSAVKKARRLMRARAIVLGTSQTEVILAPAYDSYMEMINDAQLEFEHLKRDVKTSDVGFRKAEELHDALECMEKYLGRMIREYESNRRSFQLLEGGTLAKEISSSSFPKLDDLLSHSSKSDFQMEFVQPFHNVQESIRADLAHPQLPGRGGTLPSLAIDS
ncbi:MAG TPA: hypothetical protein VEX13_04800 [Chloroflexia bacterium]|nr:hypothetical protein [Chloroflexia bacterium]